MPTKSDAVRRFLSALPLTTYSGNTAHLVTLEAAVGGPTSSRAVAMIGWTTKPTDADRRELMELAESCGAAQADAYCSPMQATADNIAAVQRKMLQYVSSGQLCDPRDN